jgi:putative flippase GtrA
LKKIEINTEFQRFFFFSIIAATSFVLDFIIYFFLIKVLNIFLSNIISSMIGISFDYFISTSKKLKLFSVSKDKKINYYLIYILYIATSIILISYLINLLNDMINMPLISKLLLIPLSFFMNYLFFFISFKNH